MFRNKNNGNIFKMMAKEENIEKTVNLKLKYAFLEKEILTVLKGR